MEKTAYSEQTTLRGRPKGHLIHSTMATLTSIAHIAAKHNLDPRQLFEAFREAYTNKESQYEKLKIMCRVYENEFSTFMVTYDDMIVGQFPIKRKILEYSEFFKPHIPTVLKQRRVRSGCSSLKQICELRALMHGVSLKAKVVRIQPRRTVITHYGWYADVANALLADETGTISLSLWNTQIDAVSEGEFVQIEGASVTRFSGELQLRLSRNGTITVLK